MKDVLQGEDVTGVGSQALFPTRKSDLVLAHRVHLIGQHDVGVVHLGPYIADCPQGSFQLSAHPLPLILVQLVPQPKSLDLRPQLELFQPRHRLLGQLREHLLPQRPRSFGSRRGRLDGRRRGLVLLQVRGVRDAPPLKLILELLVGVALRLDGSVHPQQSRQQRRVVTLRSCRRRR